MADLETTAGKAKDTDVGLPKGKFHSPFWTGVDEYLFWQHTRT